MTEYRLAAGTISQYAIQNDDTTIVSRFPAQSDQGSRFQWFIATDDIIPYYSTRVVTLDGHTKAYGQIHTLIRFGVLTAEMWYYLDNTFFSGAESANVTMQLKQRLDTAASVWVVYNGILTKPDRTFENLTPYGGYVQVNVPFTFSRATVAAYGRSFSASFSASFD